MTTAQLIQSVLASALETATASVVAVPPAPPSKPQVDAVVPPAKKLGRPVGAKNAKGVSLSQVGLLNMESLVESTLTEGKPTPVPQIIEVVKSFLLDESRFEASAVTNSSIRKMLLEFVEIRSHKFSIGRGRHGGLRLLAT